MNEHTVAADAGYSFLEVRIDGLLHMRIVNKKLLAIVAQPDVRNGIWRIHFALKGGSTWTTYDDERLWAQVVDAIGQHFRLQTLSGARIWIDAEKMLGVTSWGTKADKDWTIEWAMEGSEYARATYKSRQDWHAALKALEASA